MNNIQDLKPFKRLCVTIGNLPTAYIESMSYYECTTYLVNYLTKEVVPTVNNNSEVVKELQTYVEHYFDNLDVQEEINNKLDEMAESGVLADIINEEIFNELSTQVNTNTNDITNLKTKVIGNQANDLSVNKFIFFGDSYASGDLGYSWISKLVDLIGLPSANVYDYSSNGGGFTITGNTFLNKLNQAITNIVNKEEITNILVAGGFNDGHFSSATSSEISSAIQNFIETAKASFPNAKITIAHIGWTSEITWKKDMRKSIKAYKECVKYGATYITNIEYTLHRYDLLLNDKYHPTETGVELIAQNLYNGLLTGSCDVQYESTPVVISGNNFSNNYKLTSTLNNGIATMSIEMTTGSVISTTELSTPINIDNWSINILTEFDVNSLCFNGDGDYRHHQTCNLLIIDEDNTPKYRTMDLCFESNCLILLNNTGETFTGYKNFAFQGITFIDDSLYC